MWLCLEKQMPRALVAALCQASGSTCWEAYTRCAGKGPRAGEELPLQILSLL